MDSPLSLLKQYWGYDSFRDQQEDIIYALKEHKDVLACLPTGAGKSVCYQVPALLNEGLTIVISPLISLIIDQVEELRAKGIPAGMLHSGMRQREITNTFDLARHNYIKFLYISPERIQSSTFKERIKEIDVTMVVIDEAHCVSQWGHDFRPSYLEISTIKGYIHAANYAAFTATATPSVQQDIISQLELINPEVFISPTIRKNLSVFAEKNGRKYERILNIVQRSTGSGLIYCTTRNASIQLAEWLKLQKIRTEAYHGGLSADTRAKLQEAWKSGKLPFLVATNAFGMGINKNDVRTIIHHGPPRSIEDYYQEIGRAGRDGHESHTMLLWSDEDVEQLKDQIEAKYPSEETIKKVYQALANHYQLAIGSEMKNSRDFDLYLFSEKHHLSVSESYHAINCLEKFGLIKLNQGFKQGDRVKFTINNQQLYDLQLRHPNYDKTVKGLMREYGANLFNEYKTVYITKCSKLAEQSESEFRRNLVQMSKLNVLDFIPAKDAPQISFNTPRIDVNKLKTDQKAFQTLKSHELKKLQQLVELASLEKGCRFEYVQNYFGDASPQRCGKCDNCRKGDVDLEELSLSLLSYLQKNEATTLLELEEAFNHIPKQIISACARHLLDKGKIKKDGLELRPL